MAICDWCEREMTAAVSCSVEALHLGGRRFPLRRNGQAIRHSPWPVGRCGDCGVGRGGFHHPGCDLAECPRCLGQLLSCDCRFDEDGPEVGDGW